MRALFVFGALCAGLLATSARAATLVDMPLNAQVNKGILGNAGSPLGDAIYVPPGLNGTVSFVTEGADAFTRVNFVGKGWYYGPYVDWKLAGQNAVTPTNDCVIEFDARYFQSELNTRRYADAPIFLRLYSVADDNNTVLGYKDFGIVYATQRGDKAYPDWTHVVVPWSAANPTNNGANVFDPTRISRLRMYGTNWDSPADDASSYIDVKNFRINCPDAIPEPGSMALLAMGALPLLGLRRRKA